MKEVFLGLDMGGTRIKIALVEKDGTLLKVTTVAAKAELTMQERLEELVTDIERFLGRNLRLAGVGIAFPGIVDHQRRKIVSRYVKYPEAHKADLQGWAHKNWGVPLILENDARAALVGEWQYGAGNGLQNLVMVTLGTGMGSAVLLEGKLLRGKNFLAGNLGGHMSIDFEGELCNCGNKGCVETAGSTWALEDNLKKIAHYETSRLYKVKPLGFQKVFTEAAEGDPVALQLRERSLEAWAAAVINLLHAYDPDALIMGGGIMASKDQILPLIQKRVKERSWVPKEKVNILSANQTKYAGILGVCYLLRENENKLVGEMDRNHRR